jgi:predicted permease
MNQELEDHLRARVEHLASQGISRAEAESQARREFGALALAKDECRQSQGLSWIDGLSRDLRFALRILRKSPGFTWTAVLILAISIGANTAIFSVVDAALFRNLPYPEPERLTEVVRHVRSPRGEYEGDSQDGRTWEHLHRNSRFLDLAAFSGTQGVTLALSESQAIYVQQHRVSAGYFKVLGVPLALGREFEAAEDRAGGAAAVILSDHLWRSSLAADPGILGRAIRLRGEPFTVVGILPAGFVPIPKADLWTPLRPSSTGEGNGMNYQLIARLRPGTSRQDADGEVQALAVTRFAVEHLPPGVTVSLRLVSVQRARSEEVRSAILLLWAAVGLVLLIGCVNIAGLVLSRGSSRIQEIANRLALGGTRMAIACQLMTESLLLASLGGALGLALGYAAIAWLGPGLAESIGLVQDPQVDGRVALLALAATFSTTLLFGLYPAWRLTRLDIRAGLALGGRTSSSHHGFARSILVSGQLALSVMLLAGAGLVIRTLLYLTHLDPGFDGRNVMTASLPLQDARYATPDSVTHLYNTSLERLRQIPGVESAGIALTLPYQRALNDQTRILDGPRASQDPFTTNVVYVTPGLFEALRLRMISGRVFNSLDRKGAPQAAIVNQAFVRQYFGGTDPIGRHLSDGEIVGVVADTQQKSSWGNFGPLGAIPTLYIPFEQFPEPVMTLVHQWFSPKWVVRTRGSQTEIIGAMRKTVAGVDPLLPFEQFRAMDEVRSSSVEFQRTESILFASLAGFALLLAAVGVFALIAQSVTERTREFGIRMALGSSVAQVIEGTLRQGLLLAILGCFVGCLLALASGRLIRSLLWGVQPNDPLVFSAVAVILLLVAVLASLFPSLKIARINPAETLRAE